jgi:cyclomaltodextrinase / maltogenic alpha-amylase / neopullulanase
MGIVMKYLGLLCTVIVLQLNAQTISFDKLDATVWSQIQVITGGVESLQVNDGTLFVNDIEYPFSISDDTFSVSVTLDGGVNNIVAYIDDNGTPVYSDTLRLTVGYELRPEIFLYPSVDGRTVTLYSDIIDNPSGTPLTYEWSEDDSNGVLTGMLSENGEEVSFLIPDHAPDGEYYYSVRATDENGASSRAKTFITVSGDSIHPFDIKTDYAQWINEAIIYEITPYIFVWQGKFHHIKAKIPELAELGVTTLWIQPVFRTHEGGQGYGIIDYFNVRPDLGTEQDLRTLIETAHGHGLKVIFDFVPNHSSIYHPYAQETIEYGTGSHYYDFYQREFDSVPYAQHYNLHSQGFIYYFWTDLPNLNYHNPEVKKWITEAGKYWIEHFDIDGYRIDAVWGVNARNPEFMQEWRLALKRVKPEILLLGEDKATWPMVFEERFDVAFDWASTEAWVSQWVWQTFYSTSSNPTIFNNNTQNTRASLLRNSLTNNGNGYHPRAKILRFLENNDTYRFIATHDLARTKMAAALIFSLHGVPLIYNGQEIGAQSHPYSTSNIFTQNATIRSQSQFGLFDYYQHLTRLRRMFPAFHSKNYQELMVSPATYVFAFRRWEDNQNIFTVLNMGSANVNAQLQIPIESLDLDTTKIYYLTDLITNEYYEGTAQSFASKVIPVDAFSARMFILADEVIITSVQPAPLADLPDSFELDQNYPNPFNPVTTISYTVPRDGRVLLKVYDVLGREITTLVDEFVNAGTHSALFNDAGLPSGTYFYRIEYGEHIVTKRMLLVK